MTNRWLPSLRPCPERMQFFSRKADRGLIVSKENSVKFWEYDKRKRGVSKLTIALLVCRLQGACFGTTQASSVLLKTSADCSILRSEQGLKFLGRPSAEYETPVIISFGNVSLWQSTTSAPLPFLLLPAQPHWRGLPGSFFAASANRPKSPKLLLCAAMRQDTPFPMNTQPNVQ